MSQSQSNSALGNELEREIADLLGGVVHKGSGNGLFVKLDVRGKEILFSCKATRGDSITLQPATFAEAERAVHGPGGLGGGVVPGFAAKTASGRVIVCMEAWDFAELFGREDLNQLPPDKVRQRRKDSLTPSLLRGNDD